MASGESSGELLVSNREGKFVRTMERCCAHGLLPHGTGAARSASLDDARHSRRLSYRLYESEQLHIARHSAATRIYARSLSDRAGTW